MTRRLIPALALCLLCAAPAMLRADDAPPATPADAAAPVDLGDLMGGMGKSLKGLKAQLADPTQNAASLAQIAEFERFALAAKLCVPDKVAEMQGDEKAKALTAYRLQILALVQNALDIEADLLAGKNDDAVAAFAKFHAMQQTGHQEFRVHKN